MASCEKTRYFVVINGNWTTIHHSNISPKTHWGGGEKSCTYATGSPQHGLTQFLSYECYPGFYWGFLVEQNVEQSFLFEKTTGLQRPWMLSIQPKFLVQPVQMQTEHTVPLEIFQSKWMTFRSTPLFLFQPLEWKLRFNLHNISISNISAHIDRTTTHCWLKIVKMHSV